MAYTTSTLVTNWIGANYVVGDLAAADITAFIARADGLINTAVAKKYYPFNATGSSKTDGTTTYLTPQMVELASTHLAVSLALRQIRVQANNSTLKDSADLHWETGVGLLNQLADPGFEMAPAVYLNETMVWGTQSQAWTLAVTQAFLAVTSPLDSGDPPNIKESSVRIGSGTTTSYAGVTAAQLKDMRLGPEFTVHWDGGYQRYIFDANHPALYSALTTLKVTWEWDYRRDRGVETGLSGVFGSG
jgi:hypothetical protein